MRSLNGVFLIIYICLLATTGCDTVGNDEDNKVPVFRITGVSVTPLERLGNSFYYSDTLQNQYVFEVKTRAVQTGYRSGNSTDSEVSDEFPGYVENPTVRSKSKMIFTQPIEYKQRTIEGGINLLDDEEIKNSFDGSTFDLSFPYQLSPFATPQVRMEKESFQIKYGNYSIQFIWETEEGAVFRDTVNVYFDTE